MLATLGDLVEDIVIRMNGPIHLATDTPATIVRRRGGSAANVAETAARLGRSTRFIGQVGVDAIGSALVQELAAAGVDTSGIRRAGSTGTIVVLVDHEGERSMLTDRRTCEQLDRPEPQWLDGVDTLHVPLYSLAGPPLSETATTMIGWAHQRGIAVSIDASSASLIESLGRHHVLDVLSAARPTVVFANSDEARSLGIVGSIGGAITVVKNGADPAVLHRPGHPTTEIEAIAVPGASDTTAAGDAFAAGFLSSGLAPSATNDTPAWVHDPIASCHAGHRAAADLLRRRWPPTDER